MSLVYLHPPTYLPHTIRKGKLDILGPQTVAQWSTNFNVASRLKIALCSIPSHPIPLTGPHSAIRAVSETTTWKGMLGNVDFPVLHAPSTPAGLKVVQQVVNVSVP